MIALMIVVIDEPANAGLKITRQVDADYHMRVVASDIDAYHVFLNDVMFKMPGVAHVRSHIILKEIKGVAALPLDR